VAYPAYLREKARQLRRNKGLTIDELAECLALPRTTIYYWVRDLSIVRTTKQTAAQRAATRTMVARCRDARELAYEQGRETFDELARDPSFRDFINLYLAEGYKRSRNRVAISNSDPAVIRLADSWMRRLSGKRLKYAVQYHRDQDPVYLRRFWSFGLGIEPERIQLQRKSNSNSLTGRQWRSRWGVVSVIANDTQLRMRVEGWIVALRERWLDSVATGV
jgi:hypothetical protein